MPFVRVTLHAVGYPKVSPNCLLVLQKLCAIGFSVVMKDVFYHNREAIIDYFDSLGIPVTFSTVYQPEIDIRVDRYKIFGRPYHWYNNKNWEEVDKSLMEAEVYSREDGFKPCYLPNTYFVVYNYGDKDQNIDSKQSSMNAVKQKATRSVHEGKARSATIIDANTLRIVGVFENNQYEEFTDLVYFNSEL